MNKALTFLMENVNTGAFVAGFALLYAGVGFYSVGAANITAGAVLMVIGVLPYLRKG